MRPKGGGPLQLHSVGAAVVTVVWGRGQRAVRADQSSPLRRMALTLWPAHARVSEPACERES